MDAPSNRKRRRRCRESWVLWNILSASYLLLSGTGVNGTRIGPAFSTSQGLVRRPILPRRHRVDQAPWTRGAATLTSDVGATGVAENMAPEGSATVLRYSPARLGEILGGSGRGKMVWKALQRGKDPFETNSESPLFDATVTSKTRELLRARVRPSPWKVVERYGSSCGTEKALVCLEDGTLVETVVIPTESRTTVCVSSQAGCAQACSFCSTGMMGFKRHLTTDEILMQVHLAMRITREKGLAPLRNIVFMGMGEPLNNPDSVGAALRIVTDPHAFALSPGFITVSTVAPSPAHIRRLVGMPAKLAWSVHAADDILRKALVPTTRHPMAVLRSAFLEVMDERGDDEIFIEVTLIEGVNDTLEDAEKLVDFLRPFGQRCKVNLIPYNSTGVPGFRASPMRNLLAFQALVREQGGWPTFLRTPRGREEKAACGQLATEGAKRLRDRPAATPASPGSA